MSPEPPPIHNIEEAVEPRDWSRIGILIALQPLSWQFGIDRSQWRQSSLDIGPFRITVGWP